MGLTATVSSVSGSVSVTSLISPVGMGVGALFATLALVGLLVYLNLLDAAEYDAPELRRSLLATIIPLSLAFGGIVLFESLAVI